MLGLKSKALHISRVIDVSCWTQITRDKTWLMWWKKIIFYEIIKQAIENEMFRYLTTDWEQRSWSIIFSYLLSPFWWIGTAFAFFHWSGNSLILRQFSKISFNGLKINFWDNFCILIDISSCSWALLASRDFRIFKISDFFNVNRILMPINNVL